MTTTTTVTTVDDVPAAGRLRRAALAVAATLFAGATSLASFGLPSALTAWTTSGDELALRTHYVVWGALAGVLLPVAALGLVRRPGLAPARQLAAFAIAAVAGVLLAPEPENLEYVGWFTAPVLVLLALHPQRRRLLPTGRPDRAVLALAALATGPAGAYAVANARLSAGTPQEDPLHGGYLQAAILALALVLTTVAVAYGGSGRWLTAACVVVATAMLGVAGVLFPADPSSVGRPAGALLLIAAGALAALSARQRRDDRAASIGVR